jgi:hypothetical protein
MEAQLVEGLKAGIRSEVSAIILTFVMPSL